MNLISTFNGVERFYQKFNGSMFRNQNNEICVVDLSRRTGSASETQHIACKKLRYTASGRVSSYWDSALVPYDFFQDMSVFSTPSLGWRESAGGKVLMYITRNDSTYHRGTSVGTLNAQFSMLSNWLESEGLINLASETSEPKMVHMVMEPRYKTMTQGIADIQAGRAASFAINERVAVTPGENDTFDIWYRTKIVGRISHDGTIDSTMKYIFNLAEQETA